jgi:hypothetical protein
MRLADQSFIDSLLSAMAMGPLRDLTINNGNMGGV